MHRLINYKKNLVVVFAPLRSLPAGRQVCVKFFVLLCAFVSLWFNSFSQRQDILLNESWKTMLINQRELVERNYYNSNTYRNSWKIVNIPHNWDDYYGYRRLMHGNLHGDAIYMKEFVIKRREKGKRYFLFFEGVGSYATVYIDGKKVGSHAGGRTTFTFDVTDLINLGNYYYTLEVQVSHPVNIKDLPWVCGGCSDERGFSEGSQPLGIFRPVHLIITNDVRIEPFGVHAWADLKEKLS
jgi:beta-galactosidase